MKNIFKIKNLAFATILVFVFSYNVCAQQTYPLSENNSAGTDQDNYLVNKDKSLNTARLRLLTNAELNGTTNLDNNNRDFNINLSNGAWNDQGQKLLTIIQNPNSGDPQDVLRGNVGIGTSEPKTKLHVYGGFRIEDKFSMSSTGNFDIDAPNVWGGRVRVLQNGNFGIGNINPTAPLTFNTSTANKKIALYDSNTTSNEHQFYGFGVNDHILRYQVDGLASDHVFYAGKSVSDSNELMRVKGNGNIGLGFSNPQGRIHMYENTGTTLDKGKGTIILEHGNNGGENSILFKSKFNVNSDSGYIKFSDDGSGNGSNSENSLLEIGVGDDGPGSHQDDIALMPSGFVGIGTRKPSSMLTVNGKATALDYALVSAIAADYVFEDNYKLITLSETEAYIKTNKHLPAFKSAKHYEANGYTMIEMNIALEQTVEELTLHAIAQEKEISSMKNELAEIKALLLAKKK